MSSPSTLRWDHPCFHGSIHWNCCECKSATWLVVKWRAGASPPVDPANVFHMTPELKGDAFFPKASILVYKLYEISGVQFHGENMVWISFGRLAYSLFGLFFGSRLMLRNWPFLLDTVPPCQACKFKNFISDFFIGSKSWKASRFSVGFPTAMHVYKCTTNLCIPTKHCILHTAYQRSHYQCRHVIGMSLWHVFHVLLSINPSKISFYDWFVRIPIMALY